MPFPGHSGFTVNPTERRLVIMKMPVRILLGLGIIALDLAVFFVPLAAVFVAYVIIYNPPWCREFLNNLDAKG
jgi:uncharacterized membrane protein